MTTKITVHALHGWPVKVEKLNPHTGKEIIPPRIVPAGASEDFYIHSDLDLRIHEIQPDPGERLPLDQIDP